MAELSFRDFAGAVMQGDEARASSVLQELLALPTDQAVTATSFFAARIKDPTFMVKAMGLRTAVQSGTDDEISDVLGECFGLEGEPRSAAVAALRKRYPRG